LRGYCHILTSNWQVRSFQWDWLICIHANKLKISVFMNSSPAAFHCGWKVETCNDTNSDYFETFYVYQSRQHINEQIFVLYQLCVQCYFFFHFPNHKSDPLNFSSQIATLMKYMQAQVFVHKFAFIIAKRTFFKERELSKFTLHLLWNTFKQFK